MPLDPRTRLLTYTEAAVAAGVTKETLYRWIRLGRLRKRMSYRSATPHVRIELGQLADIYPTAPGILELLSRG